MARRGRQQFQFTTLEMVALAASFTVTAVLVFVLGFYVGKRNAAEHRGVGERVARIPVRTTSVQPEVPRVPVPASEPEPDPEAPVVPPHSESEPAEPEPAAPEPIEPAKADAVAPPRQPDKPAEKKPDPRAESGRSYAVQVLATRREDDAEAMARSLQSSGFDAYVRRIDDGQGAWFRVRVGRFAAVGDARAMADRCRRDLGLDQAYVTTY